MSKQEKVYSLNVILTVFVCLLAFSDLGYTAEIRIPEDYTTITEALVMANDGDTIRVAAKIYSEPNEIFPLRLQKAVTLAGISNDPNDKPHLRGNGKHTVVLIESGGATLQGFKITDGLGSEGINSMDGGGVCVFVGSSETNSVTIQDCVIEDNNCPSDETYDGCGGGIYCGGTYCTCFKIKISNCTIRRNFVHGTGGGISCALLSNVNISDTYIESNTADDKGGGVYVDVFATLDMNNANLIWNNCPGDPNKEDWGGKGGGLSCESYGFFTATNCTFSQNTAKYFGGGIFTQGGFFTGEDLCGGSREFPFVSCSLIEKNDAGLSGGGVYIASSAALDFSETTLYRNDVNHAKADGGAVYVAGGPTGGGVVYITDECLLEGNECGGRGGGIYLGPYTFGRFESTRFLGNSALLDGGGLFLDTDASCELMDCCITYNNSARSHAGGIHAKSQSRLDLNHCSVVGNFAPYERSGLYLDPNTVVHITDSILWRNAGGSVETNGAAVNIRTSLSEDGADPNNGVLCCNPGYVGWGGLEEIYVDESMPGQGLGTFASPYNNLQIALDSFNFRLAENSPCVNAASDGGNMGADTGVGGSTGNITAKLQLMDGIYDIRGRNIIFIRNVQGLGHTTSVFQHAVFGGIEEVSITAVKITGEEIFGGIVTRADANFLDCDVSGNSALADGGGVYVADGNCVLNNCFVSYNTSGSNGGGLYSDVNTVTTITSKSWLSDNSATAGGGIHVSGQFQVTDSNFVRNNANIGGAIYVDKTADADITDSNIVLNQASQTAGGLMCYGKTKVSKIKVEPLFEENNANNGGAICINPPGMLLCQECIFKNNVANSSGGVIQVWGGSSVAPVFLDCEFIENSARQGGVGRCYGSTRSMFDHCRFRGNNAIPNHGGCFYLQSTATRFHQCTFSESEATNDGGVVSFYGSDTSLFEDCNSADSVAGRNGGAFYIAGSARPIFSNVYISNSRATDFGGGISILETAAPLFVDANISECQAMCGGGIYAGGDSRSIYQQCVFSHNLADGPTLSPDGGGAWLAENAYSSFVRCKFKENFARDDGGGISVAGPSRADMRNTLFFNNRANNTGGGVHFTSTSNGDATGFIANCTIFGNMANGANGGGGTCLETGTTVAVDSSIICHNSPDGIPCDANNPNLSISNSCLQELCPGFNNLLCDENCTLNPVTLTPEAGSACIDRGNPDPNMSDACRPPGQGETRNDMGITGGPYNCVESFHEEFEFNTFSDLTYLILRGNATLKDGFIRLTEPETNKSGGVWYVLPVHVQGGFETVFSFRIDRDGAEGFAFVVQNTSTMALGTYAYFLGYNIPNSIAVEFDTWRTWGYENANHISVQTRGLETNDPHHEYSLGSTESIPFLSDNEVHTIKISYIPGQLCIFMGDSIEQMGEPVLTVSVDLENIMSLTNGRAFVGFTAATRGNVETHDILQWSFVSTGTP